MDIQKANITLLELADKYQSIRYQDIVVSVPYFINTAEQVYKQTMKESGIDEETVNKVIRQIKDGKTPLGSSGGKGTPEEITQDLGRLMVHLDALGFHPVKETQIRSWMVEMHVGLDCAGYVYNILKAIEKDQNIELLKFLAWKNPEEMKPSHAGAFIFDSDNLKEISNYKELQPLDIAVEKDHTHVGILAYYQGGLAVSDCSMGKNGITFNRLVREDNEIVVADNDYWTNLFKTRCLTIRRFC